MPVTWILWGLVFLLEGMAFPVGRQPGHRHEHEPLPHFFVLCGSRAGWGVIVRATVPSPGVWTLPQGH